jgi:hypothetical protein
MPTQTSAPAERRAIELLAQRCRQAGWSVRRPPRRSRGDLLIEQAGIRYLIALRTVSGTGSEPLVAGWARAAWEAAARARDAGAAPFAVVLGVHGMSEAAARKVLDFAAVFAPEVAAGVVGPDGFIRVRGNGLSGLDAPGERAGKHRIGRTANRRLFSDVNQWILKVLLAADLPPALIAAPRGEFRLAAQLAAAAGVSAMSVSRLLATLRAEHFIDESGSTLRLVRRAELLDRWQSATALEPRPELAFCWSLRGRHVAAMPALLAQIDGILAHHAAADALGYRFVSGVPAYVYVDDLARYRVEGLPGMRTPRPGEPADLIVAVPGARKSVRQGAVETTAGRATDVLQTWLDVRGNPARGVEQAAILARGPLAQLLAET